MPNPEGVEQIQAQDTTFGLAVNSTSAKCPKFRP
jgi:hypothetical protein